jgi:phosphoglycolate phosphatase
MTVGALRYDLWLFDLDGTLADTADDVAAAMNHVLDTEGLPRLPRATVVQFVGYGVRRLVERVMEAMGRPVDGRLDPMVETFLAFYRGHMLDRTRLFPGVAPTLERLAAGGARLAVVTNKPEGPSRAILEGLGVAWRFAAIVGGDSLERKKPDPLPITHLVARFGADPSRTLMVGDTGVDIATARAAGVRSCVATYGYAYRDDLSGADHAIAAFEELTRIANAGAGASAES